MDKIYNVKGVNVDKIKALAKEQGKTMTFICGVVGKSAQFLSSVRNGRDYIDNCELQLIADELQTTVEYLTDKTDQKEKPTADDGSELRVKTFASLLDGLDENDIEKIIAFMEGLKAAKQND